MKEINFNLKDQEIAERIRIYYNKKLDVFYNKPVQVKYTPGNNHRILKYYFIVPSINNFIFEKIGATCWNIQPAPAGLKISLKDPDFEDRRNLLMNKEWYQVEYILYNTTEYIKIILYDDIYNLKVKRYIKTFEYLQTGRNHLEVCKIYTKGLKTSAYFPMFKKDIERLINSHVGAACGFIYY